MATRVDLRELAVDRSSGAADIGPRPRWIARYAIPAVLLAGFVGVVAWAARDAYLPRRAVTVAPVLVTHAQVRQAGTPLFKAAGWIQPRPTPIRVAALAPGVIEELLVVEDQPVKAGEPIAYLVDDDARLLRDRAEAELQLQQAALQRAEARLEAARTRLNIPVHLEALVADAEAQLAQVETELAVLPQQLEAAEANLRYQKLNVERQHQLSARGAVNQNAADKAQSEFEAAGARVAELKRREPALEQQREALQKRARAVKEQYDLKADEKQALGEAEADVASMQAEVERARVALAEAELRLERMTIPAPADGRILDLVSEPGARMMSEAAGEAGRDGTTVVTMYQPDKLQVRVDVRFEDLPKVQTGQPVLIESPALVSPVTGHVLFLTSLANIQKNTLEAKVGLDNPPEVLKPETLVDATFLAPQQEGPPPSTEEMKIYVPKDLIVSGEGGSHVWVADIASGVARRRTVEVGPSASGDLVEVTKGLDAGSRLIVAGREGLEDGERIEITGEDDSIGTRATGVARGG